MTRVEELLGSGLVVVNVGLRDFARNIQEQRVEVVELDWRTPRPDDEEMKRLLEKLL